MHSRTITAARTARPEKVDDAIARFRSAIELVDDPDALYYLGCALLKKHEAGTGGTYVTTCPAVCGRCHARSPAVALAAMKDLSAARTQLQSARTLEPGMRLSAKFGLPDGDCAMRAGFSDARSDSKQAIRNRLIRGASVRRSLAPNSAFSLAQVGRVVEIVGIECQAGAGLELVRGSSVTAPLARVFGSGSRPVRACGLVPVP